MGSSQVGLGRHHVLIPGSSALGGSWNRLATGNRFGASLDQWPAGVSGRTRDQRDARLRQRSPSNTDRSLSRLTTRCPEPPRISQPAGISTRGSFTARTRDTCYGQGRPCSQPGTRLRIAPDSARAGDQPPTPQHSLDEPLWSARPRSRCPAAAAPRLPPVSMTGASADGVVPRGAWPLRSS